MNLIFHGGGHVGPLTRSLLPFDCDQTGRRRWRQALNSDRGDALLMRPTPILPKELYSRRPRLRLQGMSPKSPVGGAGQKTRVSTETIPLNSSCVSPQGIPSTSYYAWHFELLQLKKDYGA